MYNALVKLIKVFVSLIFRVEVNGTENVPKEGGFILCSNHISCWDPIIIQAYVKRRIYFMAKAELFKVFFVSSILKLIKAIPVKRTGSDLSAVKSAIKTVRSGECLGIFPTGQRSKLGSEGEVKSGVGFIACKTDAPVLPIHIDATFKIFSKVTVNIGKCVPYWDGDTKPAAEDFDRVSTCIYDDIKALGRSE